MLLISVAMLSLAPPWIIGRIVDGLIDDSLDRRALIRWVSMLVAIAILIYVLRILWRRILYGASYRLSLNLRQQIYEHLMTLSPASLTDYPTGDIMALATNDVQAVEMTAGEAVLSIFDGLLTGLLVLAVMVFSISAGLTLIALAPWPLMSIAMWYLGDHLHRRFDAAQAAFGRLNSIAQESISGLRALRGIGAERYAEALLGRASEQATETNLGVARVDAKYDPVIYLTIGASFMLSMGGGAWLIAHGDLSVGQLTSFTLYLGQLVWPMFAFGWMANIVQRGSAAYGRINRFLETCSVVPDTGRLTNVESTSLRVDIAHFAYPGREEALADIQFEVAEGGTLGIVGPTGAGKSTLLTLLSRLRDGHSVAIQLGAHPMSQYRLATLRASMAYVMQESVLFSVSLRENLRLAAPDASDSDIERVLAVVGLDQEVAGFTQQLDTVIGERGVTLSGGQRQRLSLARALIAGAPILLLDDALSAVDAEKEHHILSVLQQQTASITKVIVSHRLSAVADADEILVLNHGRVVARGTHAELIAQAGWYRDTWQYQRLESDFKNPSCLYTI